MPSSAAPLRWISAYDAIALTLILSPGERKTQVAGALGMQGGRPYAKRPVGFLALFFRFSHKTN